MHATRSRCADALFELVDTVLSHGVAGSLPHLGSENLLCRGWGSLHDALVGRERPPE